MKKSPRFKFIIFLPQYEIFSVGFHALVALKLTKLILEKTTRRKHVILYIDKIIMFFEKSGTD